MKRRLVVLAYALAGWFLCSAIMGAGLALLPKIVALLVHFVAVPLVMGGLSAAYFRRADFMPPAATAFVFTLVIVFMDFLVVATLIMRSMEMFTNGFYSVIGTWIPFCAVFLSTYVTGKVVTKSKPLAYPSTSAPS